MGRKDRERKLALQKGEAVPVRNQVPPPENAYQCRKCLHIMNQHNLERHEKECQG